MWKRKKREKKKIPKAQLSEETVRKCYKIEVETKEDLEKLREWLDDPLLMEYRGHDVVLDVRDWLLFYKCSEI